MGTILQQVQLRLALTYIPHEIPRYADNPTLLRWLFSRFGFGGGGGPNAMKAESLKKLLLDPVALAQEIRRHGKRLADRSDEVTGAAIERSAGDLAKRVLSGLAPKVTS